MRTLRQGTDVPMWLLGLGTPLGSKHLGRIIISLQE
jgi:hypothetical protein